jgi:enamine deaminase RidA (YjgF/YER057c/UK114 family)
MMSFSTILSSFLVVAGVTLAKPLPKTAVQPVVTYLGTQGPILCMYPMNIVFILGIGLTFRIASGAWTSKGIVYTSGTVPTFNGSIIAGGIEAQTVCHPLLSYNNYLANNIQAQVIKNIGVILEEAGTSWDYVMKTTVFLANMSDYTAMNSVYSSMLPSPKPARTAVEVGKLPGAFLIEIEAIAAIPDS